MNRYENPWKCEVCGLNYYPGHGHTCIPKIHYTSKLPQNDYQYNVLIEIRDLLKQILERVNDGQD